MSEDEIILSHILKCPPLELAINKPALTPPQKDQFEDYKRRRADGEPLQYIFLTSSNYKN